jgi:hypothetical protein
MKTVFELELIQTRGTRYPIRKAFNNLIGLFSTLEKAEQMIHIIVEKWETNNDKEYYCFIITERKTNPKLDDEDIVAIKTYHTDGSFYEENLVSRDSWFRGRPKERIHFKIGDIVEIYCGDIVELAIIGGTPPTTEFAESHSYSMGRFDDQYLVYDTQPSGHSHIQSQYVFPTKKPVSGTLQQKLKEQMKKGG